MDGTTWPKSFPGTTAVGSCVAGYAVFQGSSPNPSLEPLQPCLLSSDDSAASWGPPIFYCQGNAVFSFFLRLLLTDFILPHGSNMHPSRL